MPSSNFYDPFGEMKAVEASIQPTEQIAPTAPAEATFSQKVSQGNLYDPFGETIPPTPVETEQMIPSAWSMQGTLRKALMSGYDVVDAWKDVTTPGKVESAVSDIADSISSFNLEQNIEVLKRLETYKDPMVAAGAIAGAEVGARARHPAAPVVGAVLGAGQARAAYGFMAGEQPERIVAQTLNEMETEALWGGGATAAVSALKVLGPWAGNVLGVGGKKEKYLAQAAEDLDIPVGIAQIAERGPIPAVTKVIGVFPFVGGKIRAGTKAAGEALGGVQETVGGGMEFTGKLGELSNRLSLDVMAPNGLLSKIGVDTVSAARNTNKEFRAVATGLYDNFYGLLANGGNPAAFSTKPLKDALATIRSGANRPAKASIPTSREATTPEKMRGGTRVTDATSGGYIAPPKQPEIVEDYLDQWKQLPDEITATDLRTLQRDLNDLIGRSGTDNVDQRVLQNMKAAVDVAMNTVNYSKIDPELAVAAKSALDTANGWYSAGMTLFRSPAAKTFQRVDKNIFQAAPFKAGNLTADDVAAQIYKYKSPEMVENLHQMVGGRQLRELAAGRVKSAAQASISKKDGVTAFDWDRFGSKLGLDTADGIETLDAFLKTSPVSASDYKKLVELGKRVGSTELASAASFVKRRMVLSGTTKAATGAFMAGMNLPAGIATIAILRFGTKPLSDPKVLKWATTALDNTANQQVRQIAAAKLIEMIAAEDSE